MERDHAAAWRLAVVSLIDFGEEPPHGDEFAVELQSRMAQAIQAGR